MARNGNRAGAIVVALVAAAMLIGGLNALSHIDYCGESVMHQGDQCPNTSSRPHRSWLNDYDHQRARNQRLGTTMTVGSAAMFLTAVLVWVYGTVNVFRIISRRSPAQRTEPGPSGKGSPGRG